MIKIQKILSNLQKIKQKSIKNTEIKINLTNQLELNIKNRDNSKIIKSIKSKKFLSKKNIIIIVKSFIIFILSLFFDCLKYFKIKKFNIPIAFSLNNKYVYPLIVSLTSILYNSSPNTFYIFYLLLSPDLQDYKLNKILRLREKYPNCRMNLIHMGNKYKKYKISYYYSAAVYYRLDLSNLITDVDKLIYLDVDTIAHKDLTEFYNIEMGKNYYMGFPGVDLAVTEFNGTRNFINSGVILINLKKLREVNAPILFQEYYNKYGTKKVDEYLINAVFYDRIAFYLCYMEFLILELVKDLLSIYLIFYIHFKI